MTPAEVQLAIVKAYSVRDSCDTAFCQLTEAYKSAPKRTTAAFVDDARRSTAELIVQLRGFYLKVLDS